MKRIWLSSGTLLALAAIVMTVTVRGQAADEHGVAVVELFTSEGCSSCPPADRVMSELADKYAEQGRTVVWLGLHVDYWNKIGWTDPYSAKAFTQRQYHYAQAMHKQRVYTPQMIVDGRTEFVGSRRADAERAIDAALLTQRDVRLTVSNLKLTDGTLSGEFRLAPGAQSDILVALTENGLASEVTAGENEGKTLHHDHVTRILLTGTTDAQGRGHFKLNVPDDADLANCQLLVVAQSQQTMRVAAATSTPLKNM